jgi:hypothetical protein
VTEREQEKRLQSLEGWIPEEEAGSDTWEDLRERSRRVWNILNGLFVSGLPVRPFPEQTEEYWQQRLEEERQLRRVISDRIRDVPGQRERYRIITEAVSEHQSGTICTHSDPSEQPK